MIFYLLLIFISTVLASQELYAPPILVGGSYTLSTNYEGAKNSTGIKRLLNSETDDTWQFFHFCTKDGKNKDKCGAWVDENGKKIAGANNNVKQVEDCTEISKMQLSDSGRYSRHPSDPVKEALEWVVVSVQEGPKPPPPTY